MITKGHEFMLAVVLSLRDTTGRWFRIVFWKRELVRRLKKEKIMRCEPTTRCVTILVVVHGFLSRLYLYTTGFSSGVFFCFRQTVPYYTPDLSNMNRCGLVSGRRLNPSLCICIHIE